MPDPTLAAKFDISATDLKRFAQFAKAFNLRGKSVILAEHAND